MENVNYFQPIIEWVHLQDECAMVMNHIEKSRCDYLSWMVGGIQAMSAQHIQVVNEMLQECVLNYADRKQLSKMYKDIGETLVGLLIKNAQEQMEDKGDKEEVEDRETKKYLAGHCY